LFVGNLAFSVVDEDLKSLFGTYGDLAEAVIIVDRYTRKSKGFGFVTFNNAADAQKAKDALNDKDFQGRNLVVNEARPKV
jgi:RNA recognition motif-containing protein